MLKLNLDGSLAGMFEQEQQLGHLLRSQRPKRAEKLDPPWLGEYIVQPNFQRPSFQHTFGMSQ